MLGDWRRPATALAVLAKNDAGQLRVVAGRHEHKPSVVAKIESAPARTFTALQRDHLGGAGLAGDVASLNPRTPCGAGAIDRHPQSVVDGLHRLALELQRRIRVGRRRHVNPPLAIVHCAHQPRDVTGSAVGHRRHHHRQAHRGDRILSLADRDRDGLARIPALPGALLLPFARRHEAVLLVGEIDAAPAMQAEIDPPFVNAIYTEHVPQRVEICVARLGNRLAQIHAAVTALEVTLKPASEEIAAAGTVHAERRGDEPLFETGGRDQHLESGAGRIASLYRPVLQRPQLVGDERLIRGAVDAGGKRIRIVGRQADQRQHVATAGIEHDGRAPEPHRTKCIFGRLLHREAQCQLDPLTLRWRDSLEFADFAALAVDDHDARAVAAHQRLVVVLLDSRLSDDRA